jgi:hypothetical protein
MPSPPSILRGVIDFERQVGCYISTGVPSFRHCYRLSVSVKGLECDSAPQQGIVILVGRRLVKPVSAEGPVPGAEMVAHERHCSYDSSLVPKWIAYAFSKISKGRGDCSKCA